MPSSDNIVDSREVFNELREYLKFMHDNDMYDWEEVNNILESMGSDTVMSKESLKEIIDYNCENLECHAIHAGFYSYSVIGTVIYSDENIKKIINELNNDKYKKLDTVGFIISGGFFSVIVYDSKNMKLCKLDSDQIPLFVLNLTTIPESASFEIYTKNKSYKCDEKCSIY